MGTASQDSRMNALAAISGRAGEQGKGHRIMLIRHARTICPPCLYGRTDVDIEEPLDSGFAAFVRKHRLENAPVCSSPLQRCRRTAAHFLKAQGKEDCEPEIIPDLQEIFLGELDGLPFSSYTPKQLKFLESAMRCPARARIPGAEPLSCLAARTRHVLQELLRRKEDLIAVTHCGVIKMIYASLAGINVRSNRLWLDWQLGFLAGLMICAQECPDGRISTTFTVLEPVSEHPSDRENA